MAQKRIIPFGYTVRNGRTVIDPDEAECIREIFNDYINGASLKEIAERLTANRVPFTVKNCCWGKARVARIIENAGYAGSGDYDPIIGEEVYELALECKRARQTRCSAGFSREIDLIRPHVKCEKCGHPMVRRIANNCRIREAWLCQNPECGATIRIGDADLIERIRILMNRIIDNASLMIPRPKEKKNKDSAFTRLRNEIDQETAAGSPDEDRILELISQAAAIEYRENNGREAVIARLARQRVSMMLPQEQFNESYFSELVKTVLLRESGTVRIITVTDAEIPEGENET